MKCTQCGTEFDEGIFCPECGKKCGEPEFQKNEEELTEGNVVSSIVLDNGMKQEEYNDAGRNETIPKKKKPIILSIPVIFLVGIFTYGIGAIIMTIIR